VVLTPQWLASSLSEACRPDRARMCHIRKATEARKPDTPGRARYKPSNHCAGNVGCPPLNLYARVRFFAHFCTRDRGCSAHPAFPAPSDFKARNVWTNLGRIEPRERETAFEWSLVIASAAKQSILSLRGEMDCFVASAPRNDGVMLFGNLDSLASSLRTQGPITPVV
jgi:hypothetical protein